jgi:hypothetical protein
LSDAVLNVELSEISRDTSGWQQAVTYQHNDGRTRREVYCGRTPEELDAAVKERVRELRRTA